MSLLITDEVIAFAHRGGAKIWPENTLLAFQGGWEAGCRWIETDIHRSCDNRIVIAHDASVDRCTEGSGLVREKTLAELQSLDAGYRFSSDGQIFPYRGEGARIPSFREALDWQPDATFNLDIKPDDPSVAKTLWDEIVDHGAQDRVVIASVHDGPLRAFRELSAGRVPTSASQREITWFRLAVWARATRFLRLPYQALQVPHWYKGIPVTTAGFVEAAHRLGVHVHVWTIDDPQHMRQLLDLGVDAVMSDVPDVLVAELKGQRRRWTGRD